MRLFVCVCVLFMCDDVFEAAIYNYHWVLYSRIISSMNHTKLFVSNYSHFYLIAIGILRHWFDNVAEAERTKRVTCDSPSNKKKKYPKKCHIQNCQLVIKIPFSSVQINNNNNKIKYSSHENCLCFIPYLRVSTRKISSAHSQIAFYTERHCRNLYIPATINLRQISKYLFRRLQPLEIFQGKIS